MPASSGGFADGSCPGCGGRLHRLLRLPVIPPGLGISTCQALDLVTCLRCLGWPVSTMFSAHDTHGSITATIAEPDIEAGFDAEPSPLPAAGVLLAATPARWQQQDWALSNGRENLNRIGGAPAWIRNPDYPAAPAASGECVCSRSSTRWTSPAAPSGCGEAAASPSSCGAIPAALAPRSGNAPDCHHPDTGRAARTGPIN